MYRNKTASVVFLLNGMGGASSSISGSWFLYQIEETSYCNCLGIEKDSRISGPSDLIRTYIYFLETA